ncbi:MAG: ATP-binding protein [Arcobacteraceae bacterium]
MAIFNMQLHQLEETLAKIETNINDVQEKAKYKVMFVAEELLTNIVRHANFEDRTPFVSLDIEFNEKSDFNIECKDNSKAFNPLQQEDPNINANIEDRELGGLGIYLTKKYAKNLEYLYEDGFNILRISL